MDKTSPRPIDASGDPAPTAAQITPVVLCGGSGTRLWPVSRASYPKQFAALLQSESLLEQTLSRVQAPGYASPIVVTGEPFRFIVTALTSKAGAETATVIVEPEGRNTGPAALASAYFVQDRDPGALVLLVPADHYVPDTQAFRDTIAVGVPAAQEGRIVTFGVRPDRPETGYGYLEIACHEAEEIHPDRAIKVHRFIEKPDAARAQILATDGRHLWNSGIFLARADTLIAAFERHAPTFITPVRAAVGLAQKDLDFIRLAAEPWSKAPSDSIDFAVMEKADGIVAVPFEGAWTDLGGWDAVWREQPQDADGVALSGNATAIDCADTLLRSDSERVAVVGIGLENTVVVAMEDAVLVANKDRAQDVGAAVKLLKEKQTRQADQLPRDYRPWGWYESLALGERFQVKRIVVDPGASLSLQSHFHRSEHWVVVEGTAKVTLNDTVSLLGENESIYIPLGATHRLENPGKLPIVLIEVQTGGYLEEDDIVRYSDTYDRY